MDGITSDLGQIGEGFNKFYTNVGPSMASKIPTNSSVCPTRYVKDFNSHPMYVTHVETLEICTIIYGMRESSTRWDGIPA